MDFDWLALVPAEEQYVSDVLSYIGHGDPQVRGATAILCGALICSILSRSRFQVGDWLGSVRALTGSGQFLRIALWVSLPSSSSHEGVCGLLCSGNTFSLVDCVPLLQKTLKDESSVTCKLACAAVRVSAGSLPLRVGNLPVSTVKLARVQTRNVANENKRLCIHHFALGTNRCR